MFPVFLLSGLKAPSWCFHSLLVLFLSLPTALLGNDLFLCLCPIYSLRLDGEDFCLFMIITPGLDTLEEKGSKYTAPANLHYYCEFFYLAGWVRHEIFISTDITWQKNKCISFLMTFWVLGLSFLSDLILYVSSIPFTRLLIHDCLREGFYRHPVSVLSSWVAGLKMTINSFG